MRDPRVAGASGSPGLLTQGGCRLLMSCGLNPCCSETAVPTTDHHPPTEEETDACVGIHR